MLIRKREPRYLGYRGDDWNTPWAGYFTGTTRPVQAGVAEAFAGPATPAESIRPFSALVEEINGPGYSPVETGYGRRSDGTVWAAVHTEMPGVTAAMWDWWFGWHSTESSRYRLWHPDAHAFCDYSGDLAAGARRHGERHKYLGMVSYVDEYVGPYLEQVAITFHDPGPAGFVTGDDVTVVYGRIGSAVLPLNLGWLCHQIRPMAGGSEMRSRFYLNKPGLRPIDARQTGRALVRGPLEPLKTPLPFNAAFARALLQHCGAEMNHLAGFLPALHAEFAA